MKCQRESEISFLFILPLTAMLDPAYSFAGARDQIGNQFLIFQARHGFKNLDCVLEVQVTTDHYRGALVDMLTPRLDIANGGFRKSVTIQRHETAVLCASSQRPPILGKGKRDNAILLQSDRGIAVFVMTKSDATYVEMHVVYPFNVLGTVYYFLGNPDSLLIVVATEDQTAVDISNYLHSHRDTPYYKGAKIPVPKKLANMTSTEKVHFRESLHRYQSLVIDNIDGYMITSGFLIMSSKPVVLLSETMGADSAIAIDQLMPVETWGYEFAFVTPSNPSVTAVTFVITVQHVTPWAEVRVWRPNRPPGSYDPWEKFMISYPNNTLSLDVFDGYHHLNEGVEVILDVPASLVLVITTSGGTKNGLSVTKIPPSAQFYDYYLISVVQGDPFETYLHVISESKPFIGVHGANWTTVPYSWVHEVASIYYHFIYRLNPGVYVLTHDRPGKLIGAFLESYHAGSPTTLYTEVGMRLALVNEQHCTVTASRPGDTLDNDCNHLFDEDATQYSDYDRDGIFGEDVAATREDGQLSEWGEWECDGACDTGVLVQRRLCTNPPPSRGGRDCSGENVVRSNNLPCNTSKKFCLEDCTDNRWGHKCHKFCPRKCVEKKCNRYQGDCNNGCQNGFYGPFCKIGCHTGYGGKNCSVRCSTICQSKECHPVTLRCKVDRFSKVSLGMLIACVVVFVVCPALGGGFYLITLTLETSPAAPVSFRVWTVGRPNSFEQGLEEYDDYYEDEAEDEGEGSSSSSPSQQSSVGTVLASKPTADKDVVNPMKDFIKRAKRSPSGAASVKSKTSAKSNLFVRKATEIGRTVSAISRISRGGPGQSGGRFTTASIRPSTVARPTITVTVDPEKKD